MLWVFKRTISVRSFFEHPKHMFNLISKKIIAMLRLKICLTGPIFVFVVLLLALCPKSTAMVMAGRSFHLITHFPGQG